MQTYNKWGHICLPVHQLPQLPALQKKLVRGLGGENLSAFFTSVLAFSSQALAHSRS